MTQNRVKLYYVATVKAVFSFCDGKKKKTKEAGTLNDNKLTVPWSLISKLQQIKQKPDMEVKLWSRK